MKKSWEVYVNSNQEKCNLLLIILSGHKQFVKQECHWSSRPIRGICTTEHYGSGCTAACDCAAPELSTDTRYGTCATATSAPPAVSMATGQHCVSCSHVDSSKLAFLATQANYTNNESTRRECRQWEIHAVFCHVVITTTNNNNALNL